MAKYTIVYGNREQFQELLKVVRDGDEIIVLGICGENDIEPIANITLIWNDALDRPQENKFGKFKLI